MQESAFEAYMLSRNLADRTRAQRTYALKRIERAHNIDLDDEFDRDKLASVLKCLSYSAADERARLPNPSKLDIEADRLRAHLSWYRSHLMDYVRFRGRETSDAGLGETDVGDASALSDELIEEAVGRTFALEKDLQAALRANLSQLEEGLALADGGAERKVDAGFIDILGRDKNGVLTVIELKAETARPEAVTQVLAYMGCIAEETGEAVRGVLVAADHHPRVVYAARATPNLLLERYRFRFEFE